MICCRILPFGAVHAIAMLEEVAGKVAKFFQGLPLCWAGQGFCDSGWRRALHMGFAMRSGTRIG